jgi:hypothetical protein
MTSKTLVAICIAYSQERRFKEMLIASEMTSKLIIAKRIAPSNRNTSSQHIAIEMPIAKHNRNTYSQPIPIEILIASP